MGHHGHEFPTHLQPFPLSQTKAKSGLTKGEEKIPGEEKEWVAKSLSLTLSSTRAFQGDLAQWQLTRRLQPAPCVCPGQEPTAQGWLSLAFVPLALLSLSSKERFPPQRPVPRGQREGSPDSSRVPEGLRYRGTPRTWGARGEDGGKESSGGRRWVGPLRPDHTGTSGRGRQLGAALAPAWVNPSEVLGGRGAVEGGRLDRQFLAMNINYFLHRQRCTTLTVS